MQAAPWLGHYDEGVPASVGPYPDRTLLDDLAEAVALRPDAPAAVFIATTKFRTVIEKRAARKVTDEMDVLRSS